MEHRIRKIIKRDGRTVDFDINKIATAIYKAAEVLGGNNAEMAMNHLNSKPQIQDNE